MRRRETMQTNTGANNDAPHGLHRISQPSLQEQQASSDLGEKRTDWPIPTLTEMVPLPLLTISQVALHLGVCRAHVYRLIDQGLPIIHLGRSVRVNIHSLTNWLATRETSRE